MMKVKTILPIRQLMTCLLSRRSSLVETRYLPSQLRWTNKTKLQKNLVMMRTKLSWHFLMNSQEMLGHQ